MLPVAERELRIGARSAGTYASRRNIAALLFLVFAGLYLNLKAFGGAGVVTIFTTLSAICFAYALLTGLVLAADCVSSEKRDGTLGLLFLTALKPYDLVAGTISATSLKAFYGLLATFPILGLSLLLGGIEYAEFARVCLTLVTTLLFSLSLCLLVSCLSRRRLPAISRAALLLFFFAGAIPIFCDTIKHATRLAPPDWVMILSLFSPTTTLELSSRSWIVVRNDYWLSLLFINSLSLAMLLASCFLLPWIWKDRAPAKRYQLFAKTKTARPGGRKLRGQNPFFWLASRQSSESTRFLIGFLALGIAASIVGRYKITTGAFPEFESQFLSWTFVLVLSHLVLLFKFAALSTARLAEDRELGALESLLVTPLRVREILRGQCHALVTQLGGPALAVLLLHGLVFWGFLTQYGLEQQIGGGARGVIRVALDEMRHGSFEPWSLFGPAAILVVAAIMAIFAWLALASIGMWIALRVRHVNRALWLALAALVGPPAVAFFAVITVGVWLDLHRGNNSFWGWFCLLFAFAFSSIHSLGLIAYAWFQLGKRFRAVAGSRFSTPEPHTFIVSFRWPIRIAAASAVIVLLFSGFYAEEKWRGSRARRIAQARYGQNFQRLRSIAFAPPAVPDAENFGACNIFKALFDYRYDASGKVVWKNQAAQDEAMTLTVTGARGNPPGTSTNFHPQAILALQKPADLAAWQAFYRSSSVFSKRCSSNAAPAQTILEALSIFDPELNELDEASRRPKVRFPIHYEETHAAYWMHLPFLKNIASVLELRATARLANANPGGAVSDIEFSIRLAGALKSEPSLFPFRIRQLILVGALNPLWEGLSRNQWDDATLQILQRDFSIDLLAEYPKSVREQALLFADFYDRVLQPDVTLLFRIGSEPISPRAAYLYPAGWRDLNQAGLLRLAEERLIPIVDPTAHRVFVGAATNLAPAIRNSHVSFDPISQRVIPWELQVFEECVLNVAHSQASLDEAVIACALERWRLAHGCYPSKLDVLTPEYLKRAPVDPITGAGYQYTLPPNGKFILYSVGWNQTDEGGEVATTPPSHREAERRKGDWVWKY